MSAWFFLALAVLSNVTCNVMLKKSMVSLTAEDPWGLAVQALANLWFWGGAISGVILVVSYLMAIRTLDLSITYAIVTASALVGVAIASTVFFGEETGLLKVSGIVVIGAGMLMLIKSQAA